MKKNHKKLSENYFRYLSKEEINNPLMYLENLYTQQTDYLSFEKENDLFLQAGLDPRLKVQGIDYPYASQRLIKQIEIAYVFYISLGLHKKKLSKVKLNSTKECYEYVRMSGHDPFYVIPRLFELMSLEEWREEIDYITCTACNELKHCYFVLHEDALLMYVYGKQLIHTLHQIYQAGGIKIDFPEYIQPNKKEVEQQNITQ